MSETVGAVRFGEGTIRGNEAGPTATISVTNTDDRAIQVTSHYHFFEANRRLRFDRARAYGMRLDIPAGTSVRFEPGDSKPVQLVAIGGNRIVHGFHGLVNGALDAPGARQQALERLRGRGFLDQPEAEDAAEGVEG